MADPDGIGLAVGLQKGPGEEGFVVLDTDHDEKGEAGKKKEESTKPGRKHVKEVKVFEWVLAGRIQLEIVAFGADEKLE